MSFSRSIRTVARELVDLVYPVRCVGCSAPPGGNPGGLCDHCFGSCRPVAPPFCPTCGEVFPSGVPDDFPCSNCSGQRLSFAFALAAFENRGVVRDLIHRFKYNKEIQLRAPLAELMSHVFEDPRLPPPPRSRTVGDGGAPWMLVPVPIHPRRRFVREFNQAEEIARCLARRLDFEICRALKRTRFTRAQARLDRKERLANLKGAFALRKGVIRGDSVEGRRLLLVDDVFTTGATASECARVLKDEGGAEEVVVLTVARG